MEKAVWPVKDVDLEAVHFSVFGDDINDNEKFMQVLNSWQSASKIKITLEEHFNHVVEVFRGEIVGPFSLP